MKDFWNRQFFLKIVITRKVLQTCGNLFRFFWQSRAVGVEKSQFSLGLCITFIWTIENCRKNSFGGKILSDGFSGLGNSFARGWKANFHDQQVDLWLIFVSGSDPLDFHTLWTKLTLVFEILKDIYATHHSIIIIVVIVATVIKVVDRCQRRIVFHRIREHKCIVYQWIIQSHCQTFWAQLVWLFFNLCSKFQQNEQKLFFTPQRSSFLNF